MTKDFKCLAIDPGGTTGFCYAIKTDNKLSIGQWQSKLTPREFHRNVTSQFQSWKGLYWGAYCVCESFEFRRGARAGLDLTPAHLIGVVMAHAPEDRLRFQTAAQGKGYWSDDKLKQIGAYVKAMPHAMDATRHLLQWYKFGFGAQFYEEGTVIVRAGS